jgi:hypothetical protein
MSLCRTAFIYDQKVSLTKDHIGQAKLLRLRLDRQTDRQTGCHTIEILCGEPTKLRTSIAQKEGKGYYQCLMESRNNRVYFNRSDLR